MSSPTVGTDTAELVVPLDHLNKNDVSVAGGKGANLGELRAAGVPVPPGFVVTTESYSRAIRSLELTRMLDDSPEAAASIRSAISAVPVPDEVRTEITRAYRELGEGFVAVRSSATAEDLPGAAFAGQQDTFLQIAGADAVVDAVRSCWASLWTDRAISYRERRGIDHFGVTIAVVVQRMVESEFAGVLFTANPVTGRRSEIVIDASAGLGEAVVSGLVTPDHFVLDARGSVIESSAGKREVIIRGLESGGVRHDEPSSDRAELVPAALAELAALGRRIEAHFGRPQDIEWAIAGGTTWIVQARPLTALPPEPISVGPFRRLSGKVLTELLPIRPYPLDMSTWTVHGHGRILTRMFAEIPAITVRMADILPEVDGVVDRLVPANPHPSAKTFTMPFRLRGRIRRFDPAVWTSDSRFAAFQARIAELRALDPKRLGWNELLSVPRQSLEALDRLIDIRIDYLPRVGASLLGLHARAAVIGVSRLVPGLTLGLTTKTELANRELSRIAGMIRADRSLSEAFAGAEGIELSTLVDESPAFTRVRAVLTTFLDEYGHREITSAFLMSEATWRERPDFVLETIRALVLAPPTSPAGTLAKAESRLLGLRRVRLTRSGPSILRAAAAARAGIAFREDTHFHAMRPVPPLRGALLEAGERLASAGLLDAPPDVLHLRLEELERISDPNSIPLELATELRELVAARRSRRTELAGAPLISPLTLYPPRKHDPHSLVSGAGAGGGTATGPVRIIHGPADFGLLRSGDVLVCPYTNPSWTPLFQTAAAVVVDSGGIASHAAIVAREYGIPAVMGTGDGTSILTDGQLVTVDGNAGRVRAAG